MGKNLSQQPNYGQNVCAPWGDIRGDLYRKVEHPLSLGVDCNLNLSNLSVAGPAVTWKKVFVLFDINVSAKREKYTVNALYIEATTYRYMSLSAKILLSCASMVTLCTRLSRKKAALVRAAYVWELHTSV